MFAEAINAYLAGDTQTGKAMLREKKDKRLSWEETYRETAREKEDWSDLDATLADGIDRLDGRADPQPD